ncbi:MAG: undecaprenyl-diphosphate phosphatase [Elusimicrobia bacterium]|nr:undecaprenyl-diphosphate phosphatase [Elusimicrobiota bacterium]
MTLLQIVVVAVIQGLAELLPVSSSAHVVVAEKLMGLNPSAPAMTFLLVMLHTGTTFAVILYFWPRWKERFLKAGAAARREAAQALVLATGATGVVGIFLMLVIEKVVLRHARHDEVEALFSNLPLIAAALASVGVLILWAARRDGADAGRAHPLDARGSLWIGAVQGLCLPFRGFSRSGATISLGLMLDVPRALAEDFSFALAVILTPPVIAKETWRLMKSPEGLHAASFTPGLVGMVFSFLAGLAALRWLSSWLERGRWRWFGWYCLAASAAVAFAAFRLG